MEKKIELLCTCSDEVRITRPWPFSRPEASQPKDGLRSGLQKDSKPDVLQFQYHGLIVSLMILIPFVNPVQTWLQL